MNENRIRQIKKGKVSNGPVIYFMSRDQRLHDNWALIFAAEHAERYKKPLVITFCAVPSFMGAGIRHYDFMLKNIKQLISLSNKNNIPFILLHGDPSVKIPWLVKNISPFSLITDFDPLKIKTTWKKSIVAVCDTNIYEVDAHNIVPCWAASQKMEFAAYTFRPKIKRIINFYLEEFPEDFKWLHNVNSIAGALKLENTLKLLLKKIQPGNYAWIYYGKNKDIPININNKKGDFIDNLTDILRISKKVPAVRWIEPGHDNAMDMLGYFIENNLDSYSIKRNDPNESSQSNLSPYIHFGQQSAQRVALEILKLDIGENKKEPFLEELIIRRELADNFCYYNTYYDSFDGFPSWAKDTLDYHRSDTRDYNYSIDEFENAETHDPLWNAAQMEMLKTGKMHGYMRMYWAKKILEWSTSPVEALRYAIYLNDKYSLDGRDPSGYAGIAWSVGGVHDRAWSQRKIFGKIRYMSYSGCKRKFDIMSYIKKINNI